MPRAIPVHRPRSPIPAAHSARAQQRHYNRTRRDPELLRLYSTARWQKFRAYIKRERIFCERCKVEGRPLVPGELVHHLVDPREDPDRAFEPENVQLVCRGCHNRIHGKADGDG